MNEFETYSKTHIENWNNQAIRLDRWRGAGRAYRNRIIEIYRFQIPDNSRILEIGCGFGGLLSSLNPSFGLGIDFSPEMIDRARALNPSLEFRVNDGHNLGNIEGKFDFIILSDLVNDCWDVQKILTEVRRLCQPETRLIINYYSRIWEVPLWIASKLNLTIKLLPQNWLTNTDMSNLLHLAGFEVINQFQEILFPLDIPIIAPFINRFIVKLFPFSLLGLSNFVISRPVIEGIDSGRVTVVIPARNEAGNIENAIKQVPHMGTGTEIIFVEGNSTDNTYECIEEAVKLYPEKCCQILRQTGKGKADAVRCGFEHATGEILMILDADLTVRPEDLTRFYDALVTNKGEFINGVRLVYPMEKEAMRFFNFLGNKFFSIAFSWLLGQPVKDTLCGTKVLRKKTYERIKSEHDYFGDFDPFGDFDLLFGAAHLNIKIVDMPVRYHERIYGTTNISRWSHGWLLLKMLIFAARRLKFI